MTLKLDSFSDWSAVELKAQEHEMSTIETPAVPMPTTAQQLLFAITQLANAQARIKRLKGGIGDALLWLRLGETSRARQSLSQIQNDL